MSGDRPPRTWLLGVRWPRMVRCGCGRLVSTGNASTSRGGGVQYRRCAECGSSLKVQPEGFDIWTEGDAASAFVRILPAEYLDAKSDPLPDADSASTVSPQVTSR